MSKRKRQKSSAMPGSAPELPVPPVPQEGHSAEEAAAPSWLLAEATPAMDSQNEPEAAVAAVAGSGGAGSVTGSATAAAVPARRQKKAAVATTRSKAGSGPKGKRKVDDHPREATVGEGTKKSTILALLQRPKGATLGELQQASGWQSHSVRGFLSGVLRKKLGLKIHSAQRADRARVYSIRRK